MEDRPSGAFRPARAGRVLLLLASFVVALVAGSGMSCVKGVSLQDRLCPCAEAEGYVCCEATRICVLRGQTGGCGRGELSPDAAARAIDSIDPIDAAGAEPADVPIDVDGSAESDLIEAGGDAPDCAGVSCPHAEAWTVRLRDWKPEAMAVGPDGSVFITGLTLEGAFVQKLDSDGREAWTDEMVGNLTPTAIAVLSDGSPVFVGKFWDVVDFDPSPQEDLQQPGGSAGATFVTKLMPDGAYGWTRIVRERAEWAAIPAVAATPDGGVVLGGFFAGTDLDPTAGVDLHVPAADWAPYLVKLSASGSYVWGRTFESDQSPEFYGVAVDGAGNVAIAMHFSGTMDVDPGPGVQRLPPTDVSNWDVVVLLDGAGQYRWSRSFYFDSDPRTRGLRIAFASDGDLVTAGAFGGSADFDPLGTHHSVTAPEGARQVFLTRLAASTGAQRFTGVMATPGLASVQLMPAPGNAVFAGLEHNVAIDIDPGPAVVTRRNDNLASSLVVVQLSSAGAYVSDTPIPRPGIVAGNGDGQFVVITHSTASPMEVRKYTPESRR